MTCSLCKKVGHNKRSCQYTLESLKQKSVESLKKICKDRKIENYKKQSKSKLIFMINNLPNNCKICSDPLNENDRTLFLESTDQVSGPFCAKGGCKKNTIQIFYENTPNFVKNFPLLSAVLPNNMRNVTLQGVPTGPPLNPPPINFKNLLKTLYFIE